MTGKKGLMWLLIYAVVLWLCAIFPARTVIGLEEGYSYCFAVVVYPGGILEEEGVHFTEMCFKGAFTSEILIHQLEARPDASESEILPAYASPDNLSIWTAEVSVAIHDRKNKPVPNAMIYASWKSTAFTEIPVSCRTERSGGCTMVLQRIYKGIKSVSFIAEVVELPGEAT